MIRKSNITVSLLLALTLGWQQNSMAHSAAAPNETPQQAAVAATVVPPHLAKAPYNKKLFDLAFKIYLANENTHAAFVLAESAVKQVPNDLTWRKRLAKVAVWIGRTNIAVVQWLYILRREPSPQVIKKLQQSLRTYREDILFINGLNIALSKNPHQPEAWQALVKIEDEMANAKGAIAALHSAKPYITPIQYYTEIARLYRETGQTHQAEQALLALEKEKGMSIDITQQIAAILVEQNHLKKAYWQLAKAESKAKANDTTYWKDYGDIAWLLQKHQSAKHAFQQLEKTNQAGVDDLTRLITLTQLQNAHAAYLLAKKSWKKIPDRSFATTIIELGSEFKDWNYLRNFYAKLPENVRQALSISPVYWTTQGRMWFELGDSEKAMKYYQIAFQKFPDNINLRADYIWFLLEKKDKLLLANTLEQWRSSLAHIPELWEPYAAAYLFLKQPKLALEVFQWQLAQKHSDYIWLINLAYALDEVKLMKQAYNVRKQAWFYLKRDIAKNPSAIDRDKLYAYLVLSSFGAKTDSVIHTYKYALATSPDQEVYDSMLNYSIEHRYFALARFLENSEKNNKLHVPPNIQIATAIHDYDTDAMAKIIKKHDAVLADTEKYGALDLLGEHNRAATQAYNGLEKNPHDSDLYDDATPILLKQANSWFMFPQWAQYGSLQGPRLVMNLQKHITPRIIITPFTNLWRYRSTNKEIFSDPPNKDYEGGVKLKYLNSRGFNEIAVSYRNALTSFATALFTNNYRVTQRLVSILKIGHNQRADETNGLLIAGFKDYIDGQLNYELTARDIVQAKFAQNYYYDQTRTYLGQGQQYEGAITHRFWQSYPDYTLTAFANVHRYHAQGIPSTRLLRIFPDGIVPLSDLLMPENFVQYGFLFHVGTAYIEEYTHDWKPFAEVGVFNDSNLGIGYSADTGIGTSILGRDHLALLLSYSKNSQGVDQINSLVGIRYQYYFS